MTGVNDRRLVLTLAVHQLIAWGTLSAAFPVFIAPMEAELGWSRAAIAGAYTTGLLASGLAAIPAGRWADRYGGRGILAVGAGLGALLLLAWAMTSSLVAFYALWVGIGVTHAMCLSDPAYAVVVANARDPRRVIAGMTFVTGFCTSVFVPLGAVLVEAFGWRGALFVFAGLQLVPTLLAWTLLKGTRGSLPGGTQRGAPLAQALKRRAFWALAVAFCAQAFILTGLAFHILPLLEESGMPLASALLVVAAFGPGQVAARAVLFALGPGRAGARAVGLFAFGLLPPSMVVLAFGPPNLALALLYVALYAVGHGLLTIVRATGIAEILGPEGYGQVSGALTVALVLPRTAAPVALGLVWEAAGGYGPVPWLLLLVCLLGWAAFTVAALDRGRSPASRGG